MVKKRILFVCLGNIVRSPVAQALFDFYALNHDLAGVWASDSAGTGPWHIGESPDPRMLRIAARQGFQYTHQARQVTRLDLADYDLIVAMDHENYADLLAASRTQEQRAKIRMLREWDPVAGGRTSVPDPFYDGLDSFEEVYTVIDRSVQGLVAELVAKKESLK